MYQKIKKYFIICILLCIGNFTYAIDGISIGYGRGVSGIKPLRIGIQKSWHKQWLQDHLWNCKGYWELSAYYMKSNQSMVPYNNKLTIVALTPVFRLYRTEPILRNKDLYVELAVGIAQASRRVLGNRNLGINFQFEDRLGIGARFGKNKQFDLGYRFIHFSNAYLSKKNHCINLHMLYINYWLSKN